jgi:hypothetical protein
MRLFCWATLSASLPEGEFLSTLIARGASQEGIAFARNYSSGSNARLYLFTDGVSFEYGKKHYSV